MLASNYMAYMGLSENDGKTSKYMGDSWFIIITFPLKHTILIHFGGISWYNYLNFRHPSITHTWSASICEFVIGLVTFGEVSQRWKRHPENTVPLCSLNPLDASQDLGFSLRFPRPTVLSATQIYYDPYDLWLMMSVERKIANRTNDVSSSLVN